MKSYEKVLFGTPDNKCKRKGTDCYWWCSSWGLDQTGSEDEAVVKKKKVIENYFKFPSIGYVLSQHFHLYTKSHNLF